MKGPLILVVVFIAVLATAKVARNWEQVCAKAYPVVKFLDRDTPLFEGQRHRVKLYSGGQLIGEWETVGSVRNYSRSETSEFVDARTGKIVVIQGTVVISAL